MNRPGASVSSRPPGLISPAELGYNAHPLGTWGVGERTQVAEISLQVSHFLPDSLLLALSSGFAPLLMQTEASSLAGQTGDVCEHHLLPLRSWSRCEGRVCGRVARAHSNPWELRTPSPCSLPSLGAAFRAPARWGLSLRRVISRDSFSSDASRWKPVSSQEVGLRRGSVCC